MASVAMNDKNGITLIKQVLRSRIETLDLQRNKLGFKTGAFIVNELSTLTNGKKISLRSCDLSYNPMSAGLCASICKALAVLHGEVYEGPTTFSSLGSTQKRRRASPSPHPDAAATPVLEEEDEE